MKRLTKKHLYFFLILLLIVYLYSFLKYLSNINDQLSLKNNMSNIVVITGGVGRIKAGIDLLSNSDNTRLLISGVGKGVTRADLLPTNFSLYSKRVDLGYFADSTLGNALETKDWVKRNNFDNIILVTDNWHVPRAKLLFEEAMPEVKISVYPVFQYREGTSKKPYLPKNILFLFKEHLKYLISHIQAILI